MSAFTNFSTTHPDYKNESTFNSSDFDEGNFVEKYLGKRYMDMGSLVVLSALYCLMFLSGVIGNLCTCVVIARNRFMHTATNYYLFSLAISDVMTLILGKYLETIL